MELTAEQTAILERLIAAGFSIVAFPLYGNAIGVRRGDCAALLVAAGAETPGTTPRVASGGTEAPGPLKVRGPACYVVDGNLSVAVFRGARKYYVWKKRAVEATPEREAELQAFAADLGRALESARQV